MHVLGCPCSFVAEEQMVTATERCAPVRACGMGREEERPLRRRLDAQKAAGSASLVGASETLQGCSAGPSGPSSALEPDGSPAPRGLPEPQASSSAAAAGQEDASLTLLRCRRQVILPRRVVHTVDQRPVVEACAPGSTCSAHAVHVQCTHRAGRRGRASRLNPFSSSEKPRRPTRCRRQRVARASLPMVPGRPNAV